MFEACHANYNIKVYNLECSLYREGTKKEKKEKPEEEEKKDEQKEEKEKRVKMVSELSDFWPYPTIWDQSINIWNVRMPMDNGKASK